MQIEPTGTILIVDDVVANVRIMFDLLNQHGFEVLIAEDGETALEITQMNQPDLILLDIMMPGLSGFETCRRLKANDKTCDIPVIFMTALSEAKDKIHGFELGAVDYVTKPFYSEEVLARINTHLTLRNLQKQLQSQNLQLKLLNEEKDEILGIAAHDLKNPLSAIQTLASMIASDIDAMPKQKQLDYLRLIQISSERMFDLIKAILDVNAIESGQMHIELTPLSFCTVLEQTIQAQQPRAKAKNIILIQQSISVVKDCVLAHESTLRQVLDNLISNAIKYSNRGKIVTVRIYPLEKNLRCAIQDEGTGLSTEDQKRLFQKFTRLKPRPTADESSTGLGLYIVKKLIEAMHGKVWCDSELGVGSTFIIEMPLCKLN
jgi:two-component system, sensor histidine kinase and response regulator